MLALVLVIPEIKTVVYSSMFVLQWRHSTTEGTAKGSHGNAYTRTETGLCNVSIWLVWMVPQNFLLSQGESADTFTFYLESEEEAAVFTFLLGSREQAFLQFLTQCTHLLAQLDDAPDLQLPLIPLGPFNNSTLWARFVLSSMTEVQICRSKNWPRFWFRETLICPCSPLLPTLWT